MTTLTKETQREGVVSDFATRAGEWLHSHDTGLSSLAIFHYMTLGVKGGNVPSDPADLGRCLRLLDRFPEWRIRMPEMANVSDNWALLLPHWDEIEASFLDEAGGRLPGPWEQWQAPKTYKKMKNVFYDYRAGVYRRRMPA